MKKSRLNKHAIIHYEFVCSTHTTLIHCKCSLYRETTKKPIILMPNSVLRKVISVELE